MASTYSTHPLVILVEIIVAAGILWYLFMRKRPPDQPDHGGLQQVEIKLLEGCLSPTEVRLKTAQPGRLMIHRYDREPEDEIFEIDALKIHELLPALHTTIIALNPTTSGRFTMTLGGDREAGTLIVE